MECSPFFLSPFYILLMKQHHLIGVKISYVKS
nr:MAG TPA: hypothetical protein [Caudoviricetes sp.]